MTMNGIGLNGRCSPNDSGVRGEMKVCRLSGVKPLDTKLAITPDLGTLHTMLLEGATAWNVKE